MSNRLRVCSKCLKEKDEAEFYISTKRRCKTCISLGAKRRYDKIRKHRELYPRLSDEEKKRHKRNEYMRRIYGITLDEYEHMFSEQEGRCAICGESQLKFVKALAIDHDHRTGKIRALLCKDCNVKLY